MTTLDYGARPRTRDQGWAIAVYIAYLVGAGAAFFVFAGAFAALLRAPAAGLLWRSHFRFQQRGFVLWAICSIGLAVSGFFIFTMTRGVIPLLPSAWGLAAFFVFAWWVARNVIGLIRALDGRPVADPRSLWFGR